MKRLKLPKLPMWAWGAAGLVAVQQLRKRGHRSATSSDGSPEGAITILRDEMQTALNSKAFSEPSRLKIKAANLALSANPNGSLSQAIVAELVPKNLGNAAAYTALQEIAEDQRLAFAKEMAAPYGLFQVKKMVAFGAWTYLHFGGNNPSVIVQGQKYLGVPQTGVLDMATINQIKAITGRGIWSQVMLQVKQG